MIFCFVEFENFEQKYKKNRAILPSRAFFMLNSSLNWHVAQ